MSDELPIDQNEETRDKIERLLPKAVGELETLIENGGKRTVRLKCDKCGHTVTGETQVADADLLVKAVSALSSALPRMQSKDDTTSRRAAQLLRELADMTNEELAEYIAQLEREERESE